MFQRPDSPVWYTRVDGRRVSLKTADKRIARERERDLQGLAWRRAQDPPLAPAKQATLGAALKRYMADRERVGRTPETIAMIELHGQHALRLIGSVDLGTLDATVFDRYVDQRENEGAARPTIAKELSTFRGCLRHAKRRGEFRGDLDWIPRVSGASKPGTRSLTYAEALRLLAVLPAERRAVIAFILATGADLSSVFRARRKDFDLTTWRVLVRGTKTRKRLRVVPIAEPFRRLAEDALASVPFQPWASIRRDLQVACRRAGVPIVTPRDLRRSCTTILRNEFGVSDLGALARILGHGDTRMVERVYGPLSIDGLEARLP